MLTDDKYETDNIWVTDVRIPYNIRKLRRIKDSKIAQRAHKDNSGATKCIVLQGGPVDFNNPINEEGGWKLLEEFTFNNRTLIAWYNPNDGIISLLLTHLTDQPNELSRRSPHTAWGYVTYMVSGIYTCNEAADVVSLYVKDIEKENYWWENK